MPTDVTVPKVGLTVTEVEVVEWLAAEGDVVAQGDPLVVVTADKADIEVASPAAGTLTSLAAMPGDVVAVGGLLARVGGVDAGGAPSSPGADAAHPGAAAPTSSALDVAALPAPGASAAAPAPAPGPTSTSRPVGGRLVASPLARRHARDLGVDLGTVTGTGPGGRIVRADVVRAASSSASASTSTPASSPEPAAATDLPEGLLTLPMSAVRRVTARRMAASARTTAPASLTVRCDVSQAVLRQQRAREAGVPATLTHVVMLAAARALAAHPGVNAYFLDDQVVTSREVNLGLAVDVDGDLLVPVVRDCAAMGLRELVEATRDAVARARSGSLSAEDSTGTFTLSNLGMFGIEEFVPIINAPQVAILGVGAARDEVVVVDDEVRVRPILRITLAFDHRAVDGAPAARFLADLRRGLEAADVPDSIG